MVADGDYYILTKNENSFTNPARWFAAGCIDTPTNIFAQQVAFDVDNNLDFGHTDNLRAFTFERITGSSDYRIYTDIGGVKYYLFIGNSRTEGSASASLNPGGPKLNESKVDLSRWDVVCYKDQCAIINHAYADLDGHNNSFSLYFKLRSSSDLYLASASWLQMTDNQGSYGTTYFRKTYYYFVSSNSPSYLRLYDIANNIYLP